MNYIQAAESFLGKTVQARNGVTYDLLQATWDNADGPIPSQADLDATLVDISLEQRRKQRISEIDALRDAKKLLPILSMGYQVDPDQLSAGAMAVEIYAYSKSPKDIGTLTSAGGVATATFAKNHHLKDGSTITVSGATQAEYNVTAIVTRVDKVTITYPIAGTPASPATGSPIIGIGTYRWITADNQTVFLTADEFDEVFQAATEYLDECQMRGRELKDAVLAASTVEEIDAIDIHTGWPVTGM